MATAVFEPEMPPLPEIQVQQQWNKKESKDDTANGRLISDLFNILPYLNLISNQTG